MVSYNSIFLHPILINPLPFVNLAYVKNLCLLLLLIAVSAQAQIVTLRKESFETNGEASRYTSNTFENRPTFTAQYFLRAQQPVTGFNTTFTAAGADSTWFWAGEGVRGQVGNVLTGHLGTYS